jgi:hypothetical protein
MKMAITLMMEKANTSVMLVNHQTTERYNKEDSHLQDSN